MRSVTKSQDWKSLYRTALAEADPAKRLARIQEAEQAIKGQVRLLFQEGGSSEQRYELSDALRHLEVVRQSA
jgi:hypothetical protein